MSSDSKGKTGRKFIYIAIATAAVVAAILLFLQFGYRCGFICFGDKIEGTVLLRTQGSELQYEFKDPDGGYGAYEWSLGTEDLPIDVYLFNTNDWQTIRAGFTVVQEGPQWLITGEIKGNRYHTENYEKRIPVGEKIYINVEF